MSISLQTITAYSGSGGILLNAQGTGLESVGFVHRLKSFFGIGDAREQNRATLMAIQDAIGNDPRFNTPDLRAEAQRLISKESTRFAVDMSHINGILSRMSALASGSNASLDKRVDLHLAATPLPPQLTEYADADEVMLIAKQHVRNAALAAGPGTVVDVARLVRDVINCCVTAMTSTTPLNERQSVPLMRAVGRNLQHFVIQEDRTMRTDVETADFVRDAFDTYRTLKDQAYEAVDFPSYDSLEDAAPALRRMRDCNRAALEFLCTAGKTVTLDMFHKIQGNLKTYPPLVGFDGIKSTRDIHEAINATMRNYTRHPVRLVRGQPLFNDLKATKALSRYVATLMASQLTDEQRDLICSKLRVKSAAEAFEDGVYFALLNGDYNYREPFDEDEDF
jgi:hypothetical protein